MHGNHTHARVNTHYTYIMHHLSLSKTNSPSSHSVTAHVMLILVLHFIRRGAAELFWERTVTLCWLLSWRDVTNGNWDLWPPPCGVQLSYLWLRESMSVSMGSSHYVCRLWVYTCVLHVCTDETGCNVSLTDLYPWHRARDEHVSVSCRWGRRAEERSDVTVIDPAW